VQVFIDEDLKTNKWRGLKVGTMRETEYDEAKLRNDVFLNKGELVGQFNMGSTIVLVFEAPKSFRYVQQQSDQSLFNNFHALIFPQIQSIIKSSREARTEFRMLL
jgi:hypothetical protein